MASLRSLVGALLFSLSCAALAQVELPQVELLYVAAADCGFCRRWEASGKTSLRGTPWFALFVDGKVRAHGFGLHAFELTIQPAMRAALREKT